MQHDLTRDAPVPKATQEPPYPARWWTSTDRLRAVGLAQQACEGLRKYYLVAALRIRVEHEVLSLRFHVADDVVRVPATANGGCQGQASCPSGDGLACRETPLRRHVGERPQERGGAPGVVQA